MGKQPRELLKSSFLTEINADKQCLRIQTLQTSPKLSNFKPLGHWTVRVKSGFPLKGLREAVPSKKAAWYVSMAQHQTLNLAHFRFSVINGAPILCVITCVTEDVTITW